MNLYRWSSEALKQYGDGHLISFGENVYEARDRVIADLDKNMKIHFEYKMYPGAEYDDDDLQEFLDWKTQIYEDLKLEPVEISQSMYIRGSE